MARILIIDDSATEVFALSEMLKRHDHEVLSANNSQTGIAIAQAEQPDLILIDVIMPGMNGFQATRRLSQMPETKAIPVLIISAKDQETDRVWGIRQGADDYLVKPIKEHQLLSKIADYNVFS